MTDDSKPVRPPGGDYIEQFDQVPLHRAFNITLVERGGGRARIEMIPNELSIGGIGGGIHGGILSLLVDIVQLIAVFSEPLAEGQQPAGTADLGITYLRPGLGERIFAEAEVVKRGRQLSLVEVSITNERDTLIARGRSLYAFRPAARE